MSDKRGILQMFGVASFILAVLFVVVGLPFFFSQARVIRTWPTAEAQVLRSDVIAEPAPSHQQLYAAKVQILYTVNGKPIIADLTSFESSNYQATEARAAEFAVSSHHQIRYDPNNPSQARIGAGWNSRFFAVPLLIAAMAAFFVLAAVTLLVIGRFVKQPPATS